MVCESEYTGGEDEDNIFLRRLRVFPGTELLFPDTELLFPDTELLFPDTELLFPDTGLPAPAFRQDLSKHCPHGLPALPLLNFFLESARSPFLHS